MKFIKFRKFLHFIEIFDNFHFLFIQTHFFRCWVLFVSPIHLGIVSQSILMKPVKRSCKHHPPPPPPPPPPPICKGQSRILCQWNLDSGFLELYFGFQSPELWIPQAKISRIPEAGFRTRDEKATVMKLVNCTFFFCIQEPSFLFT